MIQGIKDLMEAGKKGVKYGGFMQKMGIREVDYAYFPIQI